MIFDRKTLKRANTKYNTRNYNTYKNDDEYNYCIDRSNSTIIKQFNCNFESMMSQNGFSAECLKGNYDDMSYVWFGFLYEGKPDPWAYNCHDTEEDEDGNITYEKITIGLKNILEDRHGEIVKYLFSNYYDMCTEVEDDMRLTTLKESKM